jgi:cytochrome P450
LKKNNLPPGPKGYFLIGHLPQLANNTLEFLAKCAADYGDIVRLETPTGPICFVNHPDYIEEALVGNHRNFVKPKMYQIVKPIVGNGLGISEGEFWLRQRRLVQPVFHRERIATYASTMVDYAEHQIEDWSDGQILDIHANMLQLTLKIVSKVFFNADWTNEAHVASKAFETAFCEAAKRFSTIVQIPNFIPTPGNRRFLNAIQQLDNLLEKLIQERRASNQDYGDVLSMLLHALDEEDGSGMTNTQVRDEMMALTLAGHETTALALTWAWYLLAQNPDVYSKLQQELATVLDGRSPTVGDVPNLVYTNMIVKEVLRLYPPLWFFGREAVENYTVAGYEIAAGTQIWFSPWVMHRDRRYHDKPEQFLPERWSAENAKKLPRYAYFPFGGGPQQCIGNTFATMESVLVLATIAQRFKFELLSSEAPEQKLFPTLRPKNGLEVKVTVPNAKETRLLVAR